MMTELDIAGKTTVELRDDDLYAAAKTGNKHWVAVLTDTHPQYNYERDFAMYQKPKTSDRDAGTAPVADGAVLEYVRYTHSGKNRSESYYQLVDGEAYQIDEADVPAALEGETIPDVGPGEETIAELTSVDGVGQSRAEALAEAGYESVESLEQATTEDLETVAGIGPATAETITESLADDETDDAPVAIADGGDVKELEPDAACDELEGETSGKLTVRYSTTNGNRTTKSGEIVSANSRRINVDTLEERNGEPVTFAVMRNGNVHSTTGGGDRRLSERTSETKVVIESPTDETDDETAAETDGDDTPDWPEVRDYRDDLERSDDLVRSYTTPPGERLYAYRERDHHIVVSRGDEPADRWETRVPAERTRVTEGQQLWTVPDNWSKRAHVTSDSIAYGLFEIPETGRWVKLSIPTNDWLGDAWYGVKAVGDLSVSPVGDLGSARDVHALAREYEADGRVESAVAMGEIADHWDAVETDLQHAVEWVRDEGLDQQQPGDQPLRLSDDWTLEFHQERVFRPGETIKREVDLSEYEIPVGVVLDDLRNADLLPSYYTFELSIDTDAVGMDHDMRALTEAGCSPAEALDYYMVEIRGLTQGGWADERGISQPSVSKRVSDANSIIKEGSN